MSVWWGSYLPIPELICTREDNWAKPIVLRDYSHPESLSETAGKINGVYSPFYG